MALIFGWAFHGTAQNTLLNYNPNAPDASNFKELEIGEQITAASSFTVGTQDVDVTSMQFLLFGEGGNAFGTTAYVFSDVDGSPGLMLGSISQTVSANGAGSFVDYTFATPVILAANENYWIGIGSSAGGLYAGNIGSLNGFSDIAVMPSLAIPYSISINTSYPPEGQWETDYNPDTLVYQLGGYVVPEPPATFFAVAGLAILLLFRAVLLCRHSLTQNQQAKHGQRR